MTTEPTGVFADAPLAEGGAGSPSEALRAAAGDLSRRIALCFAGHVPARILDADGWPPNADPDRVLSRLASAEESAAILQTLTVFAERDSDEGARSLAAEVAGLRGSLFPGPGAGRGGRRADGPPPPAHFAIGPSFVRPVGDGGRAVVTVPPGVTVDGARLGGYTMVVKVGPRARRQLLEGGTACFAIAGDRPKELRREGPGGTESVRVDPWKLVAAIKRDRERSAGGRGR